MTKNHNYYLDLAFQLAEKNLGKTRLNPSVGTVVVKNNTVISSGVTSINGRPHSEFNALKYLKIVLGFIVHNVRTMYSLWSNPSMCQYYYKKKN